QPCAHPPWVARWSPDTIAQIYHEVMGKLSRTRLKIVQAMNNLPEEEKRRLKLLFRDNEAERTKYATSLAARFLKETVVPSAAEITRSEATVGTWNLTGKKLGRTMESTLLEGWEGGVGRGGGIQV